MKQRHDNQDWDTRHDKFQFGTNPMRKSPFEESRCKLEKAERQMAKEKYIRGIQGVDGGVFEDD